MIKLCQGTRELLFINLKHNGKLFENHQLPILIENVFSIQSFLV